MRTLSYPWCLLVLLSIPCFVRASPIGWQEAVARLAYERERSVHCAQALKQYGDDSAKIWGMFIYNEARAEINAVIAGLVVALAQDQKPASLPDLEVRLQRGVKGREAFCKVVVPLLPDTSG